MKDYVPSNFENFSGDPEMFLAMSALARFSSALPPTPDIPVAVSDFRF
jgi:hypothetical protein